MAHPSQSQLYLPVCTSLVHRPLVLTLPQQPSAEAALRLASQHELLRYCARTTLPRAIAISVRPVDLLAHVNILALIVEENVLWVDDLGRVPVNLDRGLDVAHLFDGILLLLDESQGQFRLVVRLIVCGITEEHLRLGALPLVLN